MVKYNQVMGYEKQDQMLLLSAATFFKYQHTGIDQYL